MRIFVRNSNFPSFVPDRGDVPCGCARFLPAFDGDNVLEVSWRYWLDHVSLQTISISYCCSYDDRQFLDGLRRFQSAAIRTACANAQHADGSKRSEKDVREVVESRKRWVGFKVPIQQAIMPRWRAMVDMLRTSFRDEESYDGSRTAKFCNEYGFERRQHEFMASKPKSYVSTEQPLPKTCEQLIPKSDGLEAFDFLYGWNGRLPRFRDRTKTRMDKLASTVKRIQQRWLCR